MFGGALLGTGLTLGVLGALGFLGTTPEPAPEPVAIPATTLPAPPTSLAPLTPAAAEPAITNVAAIAVPSIVAVEIRTPQGIPLGGGSGVVYDQSGHVITNHHVVDAAEGDLFVVFSDGIAYEASVVGSDPLTDIAVISTVRPDVTPIRLGSQADLIIGERAVAVGNPLGLQGGPSVTTGILSATGRSLQVESDTILYGLLQTDAPITRGSSGGALLDLEGKLIGITTAIGVSDVGAEGLGFAVPVDLAVSVANDLINDGIVNHAMIGISGTTVTRLVDNAIIPLGVGITSLSESSAFGIAGGQVEDVIVSLAGSPVSSIEGLIARLRMMRAGDEIAVEVLRGEESLTFDVELGLWDQ